jgi:RND superfamily putative drug exporter
VLNTEDFKKLAQTFISPDGHSVRYFIQTDLNPFSTAAMDQVNTILNTAKGAQPNTTLSDASISISGYPVTLRDTRDYYDRDIQLIVVVTIIVVLLILTVLLRAIVVPLYLVGTVILSYLSAVGVGVLMFQVLLGSELHWSVAGLAFVVLVAVGADYNMLLASRLRDESPSGVRSGVIRTVGSTGGVITAAGLIFAASMFGLLFSSIGVVVQSGFVLGVGILVDTFVVRTITVPAIAALLGRASWWPARPWKQNLEGAAPGKRARKKSKKKTVFDVVTDTSPDG